MNGEIGPKFSCSFKMFWVVILILVTFGTLQFSCLILLFHWKDRNDGNLQVKPHQISTHVGFE